MERHRDRHRDVDPHHASLHFLHELARIVTVTGKDSAAVTKFMAIHRIDGGLVVRHANNAQHRPEDLFAIDTHLRRNVVKQGTANVVAVRVTRHLIVAAIGHQGSALFHAQIDITQDFLLVRRGYQRPHLVFFATLFKPWTNAQLSDQRLQSGNQFIGRVVADDHRHRQRHATLASRAECAAHQGIDRRVQIGVRHDDGLVFRRAEGLHPLAVGTGGSIDMFRHRRGADKAHRLNVGIGAQLRGFFVCAMHHIEYAVRQPGFFQQFGHANRGRRHQRRGLEHKGIAAGQRDREHPHRHHRREVEGGDTRDHAQWLHQREAVNAAADVRRIFALDQMWNAAGKFHHFDAAGQFAQRIGIHLAMLADNQRRQLVAMLFQQRLKIEHDARTAQRCGARPVGKCLVGHVNGLLHLGGSALRHAAFNLPGSRIMHVDGLIAAAQAHLPANKVTHGFHVSPSFKSAVA